MPNTREKLIELITDKENDLIRKIVWFTDTYRIKEVADHLIANGVTFAEDINVPSKWIPVSERLPDKHGKPYVCLLTFPHGGQFPYILNWYEYGDNGYVNGRHFQDEGLDGMKVTHWMPLPQPPKEGE